MRPDEPLASSCAVLVNNKAFVNSNGWPLGLLVSPQPPQSLPSPPIATAPPVWLAVVIDGAMGAEPLASAAAGVSQALQQLPPHTNVLMAVADHVASFFDLTSHRPQSWVLSGPGAPAGPSATPRLLRATGVRPTPLSACAPQLQAALQSLRRCGGAGDAGASEYQRAFGQEGGGGGGGSSSWADKQADADGRQRRAEDRRRLAAMAAAIDLSLHLLGRGMAEWDARHKAGLAAAQRGGAAPQQPFPAKPMHAARVLLITAGGPRRPGGPQPREARRAADLHATFDALGAKAAALDAQIDAIVGDAASPALPYLPDAVDACGGMLLHQPALTAPLAANIVALCGRRLGWDAFIDVRTPPGVRVASLVGPMLQRDGPLPSSISPVDPQPVAAGQQQQQEDGDSDGGLKAQQQDNQELLQGQGQQQRRPRSSQPRVARPAVPPTRLSPAAAAAPAIDRGRYYGAALELTADLPAGTAQEVQVLWEWTTADGRRVRQVSSTQLQVAERLPDFLSGLDLEAGCLLAARRLVASALLSSGGVGGRGATWGGPLRRGALPDARLAAGLALQLAAQRMGVCRESSRGLFGFGAQRVWEMPPALMPLAVAIYLLQAGPLMSGGGGGGGGKDGGGGEDGGEAAAAVAADEWRLLAHQFLTVAPGVAACMAAPYLYVQQPPPPAQQGAPPGALHERPASGGGAGAGGFELAPPVTMAVGPNSLAVLDCGTELLVFAGPALKVYASAAAASAAATAAALSGGGPAAGAPAGAEDLPAAAAPAVQFAHQLARGRLPVPWIHVLQDAGGVAAFMSRLVPLHVDVLPLQMALMPALRELSPQEHGRLMDWHRQWGPPPGAGGFGHFCSKCSLSLPVEGGLMECVVEDK